MGALLGAASGQAGQAPGQPRTEKAAAEAFLADLDAALGRQLNAVLGHPDVRRLEAAWRGLKFLVDRLNFRAGVALEVLAVRKEQLDEALYHQVLMPEHRGETEGPPLSLVVLGFAFDAGRADVAALEELSATAASLQVPLLGSVAPAFFGVEQEAGLVRLPLLWQHLEGPQYLGWNKLRDRDEARYLALATPAFLLRYAYGPDHPVQAFGFREDGYLWGGAALAVAVAVADSFARTGWPTHLAGCDVGDLPVWSTRTGPQPLAALLAAEKQAELAEAGFVVLGGRVGKDSARVTHAPTVRRPVRGEGVTADEAQAHVSLPSQLFVSRAAHFLLDLQQGFAAGPSAEAVQTEAATRLRRFMQVPDGAEADDAVSVEHLDANLPEHELFAVRLQPPARVLSPPVHLVLGLQLPKPGTGESASA